MEGREWEKARPVEVLKSWTGTGNLAGKGRAGRMEPLQSLER